MIVPKVTLVGRDKRISDTSKRLGQGYTEPGIDHKTTEFAELMQYALNMGYVSLSPGVQDDNGYTGHWEAPDHKVQDIPYAVKKAQKYAKAYQIAQPVWRG